VSRSGCSQAVLRYCGFILSECEFGRTLILSQCEPETALVIEHADLCYRAATSRARRWANRLRCCGLRIIGVSICNGKGIGICFVMLGRVTELVSGRCCDMVCFLHREHHQSETASDGKKRARGDGH